MPQIHDGWGEYQTTASKEGKNQESKPAQTENDVLRRMLSTPSKPEAKKAAKKKFIRKKS